MLRRHLPAATAVALLLTVALPAQQPAVIQSADLAGLRLRSAPGVGGRLFDPLPVQVAADRVVREAVLTERIGAEASAEKRLQILR